MKTRFACLCLTCAIFARNDCATATTLFSIATNAGLVDFSPAMAASGSNYLVYVQSGTNVAFQLLATNGSPVGSLTTVGASYGGAHVAYAGGNYLLVWDDDFFNGPENNARVISADGAVGAAFQFSFGDNMGGDPQALASDGANFLAVMRNGDNNYFSGQLFAYNGSLAGGSFYITSQSGNSQAAAAVFGKTNYLVAWQSNNGSANGNTNLTYGALVSPAGTVGGIFQISQTPSLDNGSLAVSFDGTNYLVVWNEDTNETAAGVPVWSLAGRLVSQSGTLPGNELVLNTSQPLVASLAFDGANYLLSWSHDLDTTNTDKDTFFQFLNRSATSIGPAFTVFQPQGTNAPVGGGGPFDGHQFCLISTLGSLIISTNGSINGLASGAVYGAIIPASTAAPVLQASGKPANGQFSLQLTGTPGINYAVQTSTGLTAPAWTAITTNSPANGAFGFTDTNATNATRFYRAVVQ